MELSARKEKILSSVVRDYVKSGEPVGSKAIAQEIGVSSATVRNEMADLIELGLLEQPHTSAGRVPTEKGYREYVNRLSQLPDPEESEKRYFDSLLIASGYEPERVFSCACDLLSSSCHMVSVVTQPSGAAAKVSGVQFVQTSRRSAMLLLMSSAGTMKTRVFRCDFDLTGEMMRIFFRLFNEKLAGKEISSLTPGYLQSVAVSFGDMYALAAAPLRALLEAARETRETEVLISGQMNLFFWPELEHRRLVDFLDKKGELVDLLRQKPGRVTVLIGGESGRNELKDASLVISRYGRGKEDTGAMALLGPTRMDYPRMISVLRYLSERVSAMLAPWSEELI